MGQQSVGLGGLLQEVGTVTPTDCGCCHRPMDSGDWCGACFFHIGPPGDYVPASLRTYQYLTGMVCPFDDERPFRPGQIVLVDGRGFCHVDPNVWTKLLRYVGPNQYGYGPAWEVESIVGVTVHVKHSDGGNCTIIEKNIKRVAPVDKPPKLGVESPRESEKEKSREEIERETRGQWGPQGDPIQDGDPGAQPGRQTD